MENRLLALALFVSAQALAQTEIILDNSSASFATTGTWPNSSAVMGYYGTNYQFHAANGAPPAAIVVDNTDPGFSVTGTWVASTAVSGYLGANYRHHIANGEPPAAVVADNLAGSFTGIWPSSTSVGGYYATNYQHHVAGTGASSFAWTLSVPASATYEVYARWTQHANRASNAKYTVNHAGGSSIVAVNQKLGGGSWQPLGTYSFSAGAATVSLSDEADGYVIADAVMLVPPDAAPNTATWSAAIPAAGSYEVYARWTQNANRASNARYTVNHAGGATPVVVNQKVGGGGWYLLGTYSFDAGMASVGLTDQADGYVIADAVMFLPPGAEPNTASWTPNVAQAGQYEVYTRWTQNANRANNAIYTVIHGGGSSTVTVDQQDNGGVWNLLGTFSLSPGTAHKITLTDQANGYVIADAIRLVPVAVQAEGKLYFVHTDHLNTPRLIANDQRQAVWRYDNTESFGDSPADENPSSLGAFKFPVRMEGRTYLDRETNLLYNTHRYRDTGIGRFPQADPLGLRGGGLSLYVLTKNNPLSVTDPLGLFTPGRHNEITRSAAASSCPKFAGGLAYLVMQADFTLGSQDPANAPQHAMCSPGQTAEQGERATEQFIEEQLKTCSIAGLAKALHAAQDKHAGGHRGCQTWPGGLPSWEHLKQDAFPGSAAGAAEAESRTVIERFKAMCPCSVCQ